MSAGTFRSGRRPNVVMAVLLLCSALLLVTITSSDSGPVWQAPPGVDDGMAELRRAAAEGPALSYSGVQFVASWNGNDTDTELIEVVHRPGEGTSYVGAGHADEKGGPGLLVGSATTLDVDDPLLDLLGANYTVVRAGEGSVCGRPARVVEARGRDGSVMGRFWIDVESGLLLRRETFDEAGRVAQASAFVSIEFGPQERPDSTEVVRGAPWGDVLDERERAALADDGWWLPERLDGGLSLVEARSTGEGAERVVHLSYSEGLSYVSVFVQWGRLGSRTSEPVEGLRPVVQDGRTVYVSESGQQRRVWESGGFVYTLMADAPPEVVDTAVGSLPAVGDDGFWARVGRGFDRFGSWLGLGSPSR
ncbi:hypothetical protein GCM10027294_15540 [Marinactinospora endophytica]